MNRFFDAAPVRAAVSWRLLAAALVSTALVACGGGGGGGDVAPPASSAISIATHPSDQSVVEGSEAVFSVVATGNVTYRWQTLRLGGTWQDLDSASGAQFRIERALSTDSGASFRVTVSSAVNPSNTLTSSAAVLTVRAAPVAPSIEAQPASLTLQEGEEGSFSVTAAGTSLSYQWQRSSDGVVFEDVAGATMSSLSVAPTLAESGTLYRVQLSNALGTVTSASVRLTVVEAQAAPTFTKNPSDVAVVAQQSATFSVAALGKPAPALAWQTSVDGVTWDTLEGETEAQLVLATVSPSQNGLRVRAVATNSSGTVNSAQARLMVTAAPRAPLIVRGPQAVTVAAGANASFSTEVDGVPLPTVQWQLSGDGGASFININGANSLTYQWPSALTTDNGKQVRVVAQNQSGSVTSAAARLTVLPGPAILAQPQPQSWRPGLPAQRFQVEAAGSGLTYQWQSRADSQAAWANVPGATATVARLTPAGSETSVRVAVTASNGATTYSDAASLKLIPWTPLSPSPTIDGLRAVRWVDATTAVAVGEAGTIVRSTDAGITWSAVREAAASMGPVLNGLAVGPASNLLAVGDDGLVLRSVDGGQEWVVVRPATVGGSRLFTVAFTGTHFVAAGAKGTLLRSGDGGSTWQAVSPGTSDDILSLSFRGSLGIALTRDGAVFRTSDGGASWSGLSKSIELWVYAQATFFSDTEILLTSSQEVVRSTDAGLTWQSAAQSSYFSPVAVVFNDATNGIAFPRYANEDLFVTTDGGQNWVSRDGYWAYPTGDQYNPALFDAQRGSSGVILAIGETGLILRSADGGLTWTRTSKASAPERTGFHAIDFRDNHVGVGVGRGGIYQTIDGGNTWTSVGAAVHRGEAWRSVVFVSDSTVLAYDQGGRVAASTDAGSTWAVRGQAAPSEVVGGMDFGSPLVGIVGTDRRSVQRTTDGGATWQTVPMTGMHDCFDGPKFGSPTIVLMRTCSGALYRSTDAGQTWQLVNDGEGFTVRVGFADPNTVVAVGRLISSSINRGVVKRSVDGGQTWTSVTLPAPFTGGFNVWFTSPKVGYLESWGQVFRTTDAGVTWAADMPYRPTTFGAAAALPDGSIVLANGGGAVIKRAP